MQRFLREADASAAHSDATHAFLIQTSDIQIKTDPSFEAAVRLSCV